MKKPRILVLFFGLALAGVLLQMSGKSLMALQKCPAHAQHSPHLNADGEMGEPEAEFDGCEE
jgi:hypothetical protein